MTGWNLVDCRRIVRYSFGAEVPDLVPVIEDPDLTDIHIRQIVSGWTGVSRSIGGYAARDRQMPAL